LALPNSSCNSSLATLCVTRVDLARLMLGTRASACSVVLRGSETKNPSEGSSTRASNSSCSLQVELAHYMIFGRFPAPSSTRVASLVGPWNSSKLSGRFLDPNSTFSQLVLQVELDLATLVGSLDNFWTPTRFELATRVAPCNPSWVPASRFLLVSAPVSIFYLFLTYLGSFTHISMKTHNTTKLRIKYG